VNVLGKAQFKIFTPGPTKISDQILKIGSQQLPYNRTQDFSALTYEIIDGLKYIFQTKEDVVILTSSGTGAMEATVLNLLGRNDHVLIINGGTFGQRWVNLCKIHNIPHDEIKLNYGESLCIDLLSSKLSDSKYTSLLINAHETSTGVLYDIESIGELTNKHQVMFIVDGISSICADPFLMDQWHVDVALLSSQKALALPPGLSFIALNEKAKEKIESIPVKSLYFDLLDYLKNQRRGQMPYTPAIGIFLMLHERLKEIRRIGLDHLILKHEKLGKIFRESIKDLPLSILPENPSNALTAVKCDERIDAIQLVQHMESKYDTYLASSGGDLKHKLFRVSHMGDQTEQDIELLINDLKNTISEEL